MYAAPKGSAIVCMERLERTWCVTCISVLVGGFFLAILERTPATLCLDLVGSSVCFSFSWASSASFIRGFCFSLACNSYITFHIKFVLWSFDLASGIFKPDLCSLYVYTFMCEDSSVEFKHLKVKPTFNHACLSTGVFRLELLPLDCSRRRVN